MKQKKIKGTFTRTRRFMMLTAFVSLSLMSCGTTRATIQRPAEGTTTTITITTNNPITTDVTPNINPK